MTNIMVSCLLKTELQYTKLYSYELRKNQSDRTPFGI